MFVDLNYKGYSILEKRLILNDEFYRNNMQFFVDLSGYSFAEKKCILDNKSLRDFFKNHPQQSQEVKNGLLRHLSVLKRLPLDEYISTITKIYESNLDKISELSLSLHEKFIFMARHEALCSLPEVWKVFYDNLSMTVKNLEGLQNLLENDQKQHFNFVLKNIYKAHLLAPIFKLLKDNYLDGSVTLHNKLHCAMEYINDDTVNRLIELSEVRFLTKKTFLETLLTPGLRNRLFSPVKEVKSEQTALRPSVFPVHLGRLD